MYTHRLFEDDDDDDGFVCVCVPKETPMPMPSVRECKNITKTINIIFCALAPTKKEVKGGEGGVRCLILVASRVRRGKKNI